MEAVYRNLGRMAYRSCWDYQRMLFDALVARKAPRRDEEAEACGAFRTGEAQAAAEGILPRETTGCGSTGAVSSGAGADGQPVAEETCGRKGRTAEESGRQTVRQALAVRNARAGGRPESIAHPLAADATARTSAHPDTAMPHDVRPESAGQETVTGDAQDTRALTQPGTARQNLARQACADPETAVRKIRPAWAEPAWAEPAWAEPEAAGQPPAQEIARQLARPEFAGWFLTVEHPAVYTLGKSGKAQNLLVSEEFLRSRGAELYRIDRGGDITFHGPGQVVGYPILDLERLGFGLRDYIDALEGAVIDTVAAYGIRAGRIAGASGVWIDPAGSRPRKICAIGVRASRYVTMHGFALNVSTDLDYFGWINPCGFRDRGVTSIERETGRKADPEEVKRLLKNHLSKRLNVEIY